MLGGRVSFEGFCAAAKRQSDSRIHEVARRGAVLTGAMLTAMSSCAEHAGDPPKLVIVQSNGLAQGDFEEVGKSIAFEHCLRGWGMKGGKSGHY